MAFAANNANQVTLASNGQVSVANYGAALPVTTTGSLAGGFKTLGYLTDDGVSVTPAVDTTGVKAWQAAVDVLEILTSVGLTAKFSAIQLDSASTAAYFFNGTWVDNGLGDATMTFSSNPSLVLCSTVIDWVDQLGFFYRLVLSRGMFTDRDALQLQRTANMAFGLTFECLDNNGSLGYFMTTNPTILSGS
jgi:hypothetical protein